MTRKTAPRKRLNDGRPTVFEAQKLASAYRKSLKEARRAMASADQIRRLEAQLDRAEARVATIDMVRFEHTLKTKLGRITTHTDFLLKLIGQKRNAAILSHTHKQGALQILKEAHDALALAFDVFLAQQKRPTFRPTPLSFGQERRRNAGR